MGLLDGLKKKIEGSAQDFMLKVGLKKAARAAVGGLAAVLAAPAVAGSVQSLCDKGLCLSYELKAGELEAAIAALILGGLEFGRNLLKRRFPKLLGL